MPRALTMISSRTPADDRVRMMARFRRSRDIARVEGVNYWVFTDRADPTTWVEFVEASDDERIRSALRQLESSSVNDVILSEVELD